MPHRVYHDDNSSSNSGMTVQTPSASSTAVSSPSLSTTTTLSSVSSVSSSSSAPGTSTSSVVDPSILQALDIARDCPDGSRDPTVSKILEGAIGHIWAKVEADPNSYVMTRDEFAVFNYFQRRFTGNDVARLARARYWDNTRA
ncbi:hypothetical protein GMORB2_1050 [Geosmithia morbida]|uniref:Uncharacterized protein n=1 Tax=Geosmithia morbida TaxID=1094350 RepID=A0A9P4Z373_9HYPO|nr:uncharacterized protein GMORB2_1050 [Geosmithia morbida]KAF4125804.1 hypothetical protein GMORB2_1050 [Geosmithia morbida]